MNQQTSSDTAATTTVVAPMTLYEVDCGGATYWVVAPTLREAVDAMFKCWDNEGSTSDVEQFSIDETPADLAKGLRFRPEPHEGQTRSMAEEATRHTEPTVIACTEWP